MKKIKLVAILLCVSMAISGIATQTATAKDSLSPDSLSQSQAEKYLTQEQVLEAIAFTYGDRVLAEAIDSQKTKAPDGFVIDGFHVEDYSAYTNGDYAGMYLDSRGQLVICYRRGSKSAEGMRASNEKASSRLLDRSGKALVDSVAISEVEHSYTELLAAYGYLNKTAAG
ncbi:MAG: hypothetical protein FWG10_10775 [Eubacteriaceae bacterium]|nr:hypothetical protein [Eubacteriaceae bacterium]